MSLPITAPDVALVRSAHSFRLVAERPFAPGDSILTIEGVSVQRPSRYSIQVGIDEHVEKPDDLDGIEGFERYPWRFLNHSCDPNARLEGRILRALRPVARFEELTFDYATTEFEMAEPFDCVCGAPGCVGRVAGFVHLTPERQRLVLRHAAAHVVELARRNRLLEDETLPRA
jgi:hypothetical protein